MAIIPPSSDLLPARAAVRGPNATRRAVLLLVGGLATTLAGCSETDVIADPVVRPVLVHPVAPGSDVTERRFPARARAGSESELSFKVAGQIRELFVSVGETVRQGQVIAALDDSDLKLELRQAEAGYAEASARDRNAQAEYERTKVLHDRDATSDNQLEAAETEAVSARAHLQAQAQAVALARSRLGYAELHAPTDGLIASAPVERNENVNIGTPIVILNAGGRPELAFTVPESVVGSVERGMPATVRFTTLPDTVFPAEIVEIGVSSGRVAFPVTARLLNGDERIRSGMVAEVTMRFSRERGEGPPKLMVPSFAVAEDAAGRFVYVAEPTEGELARTERREVEIGELTTEGLEIEKGLEAGDQVVIAGLRFVEPGLTVRIMYRE
ncbi:MAG: efflux RND transporter periplasmic adaptor subunit [bacterium]|nr:efflux RND transporter periplasmic adaptor subunit [bacterium]